GSRPRVAALPVGAAAVVLLMVVSGVRIMSVPQGKSFPAARLRAAAPPGCVTANDPAGLIQMNRLSSDLGSGCRVPVDILGFRRVSAIHMPSDQRTAKNIGDSLQHYLHDYLVSGRSFVVIHRPTRYMTRLLHALRTYPLLADVDHVALRLGRDDNALGGGETQRRNPALPAGR